MRCIKFFALCLVIFCLTGCRQEPEITLPELTLSEPQAINIIDRNYKQLIRNKNIVQIKGEIIHQSKADTSWAFIEDNTGTALLDFSAVSTNIFLPPQSIGSTIIVEGRISADDTVMNEYVIVPSTYQPENTNID